MKIVTISDTHTQHRDLNLPEGDVLLFAGDGEFRSASELIDFNDWLSGLNYDRIIVIAGNHDFFCERSPEEARKYLSSAVYLKDEAYTLPNGMLVWGTPMTVAFMDWAFMGSEEDLERHYWSRIPKGTDILLSHGPAYGHSDTREPGSTHIGSETLARRIDELAIPYVVHGHIHGGYGIERTGKTTYVNCAVLNESYKLANEPIVIDV